MLTYRHVVLKKQILYATSAVRCSRTLLALESSLLLLAHLCKASFQILASFGLGSIFLHIVRGTRVIAVSAAQLVHQAQQDGDDHDEYHNYDASAELLFDCCDGASSFVLGAELRVRDVVRARRDLGVGRFACLWVCGWAARAF